MGDNNDRLAFASKQPYKVNGKKNRGWSETGARGVAGSVSSIHCCSKKIAGPPRVLPDGDILMSLIDRRKGENLLVVRGGEE